ncbi:MAG: (2Fe-2S)-binding protein [Deltaproteobacteria bacterium]|nr:(2Fe-2S)-binding protein [Deltaproteobacteria bacterium]
MKVSIQVVVNKEQVSLKVDSRMSLVDMLREELGLTGTHIGCRTGNCGACTVLLAEKPVKACCILAADVDGEGITTIEGLSSDPNALHPMQDAFVKHQGLQCGFCTPGVILSAVAMARNNPAPTEQEVRRALAGNLCRCTGYQFIIKSVLAGAREMAQASG